METEVCAGYSHVSLSYPHHSPRISASYCTALDIPRPYGRVGTLRNHWLIRPDVCENGGSVKTIEKLRVVSRHQEINGGISINGANPIAGYALQRKIEKSLLKMFKMDDFGLPPHVGKPPKRFETYTHIVGEF